MDNIEIKDVTILSVRNYFVSDFEGSELRQDCIIRDNKTGEEFNFTYAGYNNSYVPFLVEGDILKFMYVNGVFWRLRK